MKENGMNREHRMRGAFVYCTRRLKLKNLKEVSFFSKKFSPFHRSREETARAFVQALGSVELPVECMDDEAIGSMTKEVRSYRTFCR